MSSARVAACLLIACLFALCDAKVINAEASDSYISKVHAGFSQALQWMAEISMTETQTRTPRTVELALVGFARTGCTSFSAALKELGYSPIHDDEATEVSDVFDAMMKGSMSMDEVNQELGNRGFDAAFYLSTHKYVEWAAKAPGVKVILTVRDKKKWAESLLSVTPIVNLVYMRPFNWIKSIRELADFNFEVMANVPTNGRPELYEDLPTLEAGYDAWVDFVRKTVPAERLLVFDVRQGWQPLCDFLGKPVPSTPFPHINDRVVVNALVSILVIVSWIWPLLCAMPFLFLWGVARCCCAKKVVDVSKKLA